MELGNWHFCRECGESINPLRTELGYKYCLDCGETRAKQVKHCIVPMPKSNYIVVTDRALLIGLNTSHKGGVTFKITKEIPREGE